MQDEVGDALDQELGGLDTGDLFGDGARHQENMAHREQVAQAQVQAQMASSQQVAELISGAFQQLAQQQAVAAQQQAMVLDRVAGSMSMLAQAFNGLSAQSAETAAAVRKLSDLVAAPRRGEVIRDKKGVVVGTVTRPYNS